MTSHSWQPVNLSALGDDPPPEPSISGLVYPGSLALVYGEPEATKSWLCLVLALEQVRAGRYVVFVDLETSARLIHSRLVDLGATDEELGRVQYIAPAEPISDRAIYADVVAMLATSEPSLVVVDAMAGALALHGFDGNSNSDVEALYSVTLAPFRAAGAAVVVVDHVTKDRETRGRWPIGAQRKLGGADVGILVEPVSAFSRGGSGLARLRVQKDRHGALARPYAAELELTSDPDTGAISWAIRPAQHQAEEHGDGWKPTVLMERVYRHLKERGEPVSRTAIAREVGGSKEYVLQAIDCLISEETIKEKAGARGARLYSISDPSDPSATRSETGDTSTRPTRLPPTRGNGTADGSPGRLDFEEGETGGDIPF
jgi:hypothetical protein